MSDTTVPPHAPVTEPPDPALPGAPPELQTQRGVIVVSICGVACYFVALTVSGLLAYFNFAGALGTTLTLAGLGGGFASQVFGWWMGSSTGSAKKDHILSRLAGVK